MQTEYKVDTYLVYDSYGICKVTETENISFSKVAPKKPYYILSPLNLPSSTYYVPVGNEAVQKKLRLPLTEKEIKSLLEKSLNCHIGWIEARQERNETFGRILSSGISAELIALIVCLFERKTELSEKGKKLSPTDEGFFTAAEKLVREEFAFSLGISPENVTEYIHTFMDKRASIQK